VKADSVRQWSRAALQKIAEGLSRESTTRAFC